MRKSKQEMLEDVLTRLRAQGGITATEPGTIARMFAETIIEELSPIYDELDLVTAMSYISSSSGVYLEMIGELLSCTREEGETDDNYRARISNQVSVMQNANMIAIRLKALQVPGVADIQLKRFTRGTGSYTCYVVPQVYPIDDNLLIRVEDALNEITAYGSYVEVKVTEYIPVDININLIFSSRAKSVEKEHIRNQVIGNVDQYMKQMNMGNPVIISEIIQRVMGTSDQILDMEIKELVVNNKQYFIKNIEPSAEKQFYLRKISVV